MLTLVGLHYSSWTEKARFALDHHGLRYAFEDYVPMLGEPRLRLRARRPLGPISVPALFSPHGAVFDSFEIARFADRIGAGGTLFPEDREAQIRAWNERSEAGLRAGRALVLYRVEHDARAQAEALPKFVPQPLRGALAPIARLGTAFIAQKYRSKSASTFDHEGVLRDALDALRGGLDGGRKSYLLGELTYADVAMAATLQAVTPPRHPALAMGDATRGVWTHAELARAYADLLEWRDTLYAKHRGRAAP